MCEKSDRAALLHALDKADAELKEIMDNSPEETIKRLRARVETLVGALQTVLGILEQGGVGATVWEIMTTTIRAALKSE